MTQTQTAAAGAEGRREALVERLFGSILGAMDVHMVYLGDRLGLYRALAAGPMTSPDLATATGLAERYVREWLEQQAVTGLLEVDDPERDPLARRYALPAGHDTALLDADHPDYLSAFVRMVVGVLRRAPDVMDAFRSGGGVPYAAYDADFCEGQGEMNRVMFVNELASEWLPAQPDVHDRLLSEPAANVCDLACGTGWSSIEISRAYPAARVTGIDVDPHSIEVARRNAAEQGASDRLSFELRDAAEGDLGGPYDLVTVFEAVHDLSRPVDFLRNVRESLAPGGTVLVADERVADAFAAPGDDVERVMYGYSVLHCLPVGMAEQPSAGTGTVMRTETLRGYAAEAGFSSVQVLPIDNEFWRFYRLDP